MTPADQQIAELQDLIHAAYSEGHADALEICAKTDEQRLRFIAKQRAQINELVAVCRDVLALLEIDLAHVSVADAERRMLRAVIAEITPSRPVTVTPLDQCVVLAGVSKQMNEKYKQEKGNQ